MRDSFIVSQRRLLQSVSQVVVLLSLGGVRCEVDFLISQSSQRRMSSHVLNKSKTVPPVVAMCQGQSVELEERFVTNVAVLNLRRS